MSLSAGFTSCAKSGKLIYLCLNLLMCENRNNSSIYLMGLLLILNKTIYRKQCLVPHIYPVNVNYE